jgi:prevent-host-death family protein
MGATIASVTEARRNFADICNRAACGHERIVIGRHGKACVAVVPYEDVKLLEELEDRLDLRAALVALKEAEDEGTLSWDDLKHELGVD